MTEYMVLYYSNNTKKTKDRTFYSIIIKFVSLAVNLFANNCNLLAAPLLPLPIVYCPSLALKQIHIITPLYIIALENE